MSVATVARRQPADVSDLVDGIAARTGSWLMVERGGTVLAHGAGATRCPPALAATLLAKRSGPLRSAVSWARGGPQLRGCVDGEPVTAVELGGGATAWFVGGPVESSVVPLLAAATACGADPVTDPVVADLIHPRGPARATPAPAAVLVLLVSEQPLGAVSRTALRAVAGGDARVHTEPDAVVVAFPDDAEVARLTSAVRERHPDVTAGIARVGTLHHDWTVAARVAQAAARAATRLRIAVCDSSDPDVAAELVVDEAQQATSELIRALGHNPLHRLQTHDTRTTSDLVGTLRAWCRTGFDVTATAAILHVHSNTLRYRLRRAGEISGLQLNRPRHLLALQLLLGV